MGASCLKMRGCQPHISDLMMAIPCDRMPYLTPLLNTEIIPLERAIQANLP
jgi:hypothetical protein